MNNNHIQKLRIKFDQIGCGWWLHKSALALSSPEAESHQLALEYCVNSLRLLNTQLQHGMVKPPSLPAAQKLQLTISVLGTLEEVVEKASNPVPMLEFMLFEFWQVGSLINGTKLLMVGVDERICMLSLQLISSGFSCLTLSPKSSIHFDYLEICFIELLVEHCLLQVRIGQAVREHAKHILFTKPPNGSLAINWLVTRLLTSVLDPKQRLRHTDTQRLLASELISQFMSLLNDVSFIDNKTIPCTSVYSVIAWSLRLGLQSIERQSFQNSSPSEPSSMPAKLAAAFSGRSSADSGRSLDLVFSMGQQHHQQQHQQHYSSSQYHHNQTADLSNNAGTNSEQLISGTLAANYASSGLNDSSSLSAPVTSSSLSSSSAASASSIVLGRDSFDGGLTYNGGMAELVGGGSSGHEHQNLDFSSSILVMPSSEIFYYGMPGPVCSLLPSSSQHQQLYQSKQAMLDWLAEEGTSYQVSSDYSNAAINSSPMFASDMPMLSNSVPKICMLSNRYPKPLRACLSWQVRRLQQSSPSFNNCQNIVVMVHTNSTDNCVHFLGNDFQIDPETGLVNDLSEMDMASATTGLPSWSARRLFPLRVPGYELQQPKSFGNSWSNGPCLFEYLVNGWVVVLGLGDGSKHESSSATTELELITALLHQLNHPNINFGNYPSGFLEFCQGLLPGKYYQSPERLFELSHADGSSLNRDDADFLTIKQLYEQLSIANNQRWIDPMVFAPGSARSSSSGFHRLPSLPAGIYGNQSYQYNFQVLNKTLDACFSSNSWALIENGWSASDKLTMKLLMAGVQSGQWVFHCGQGFLLDEVQQDSKSEFAISASSDLAAVAVSSSHQKSASYYHKSASSSSNSLSEITLLERYKSILLDRQKLSDLPDPERETGLKPTETGQSSQTELNIPAISRFAHSMFDKDLDWLTDKAELLGINQKDFFMWILKFGYYACNCCHVNERSSSNHNHTMTTEELDSIFLVINSLHSKPSKLQLAVDWMLIKQTLVACLENWLHWLSGKFSRDNLILNSSDDTLLQNQIRLLDSASGMLAIRSQWARKRCLSSRKRMEEFSARIVGASIGLDYAKSWIRSLFESRLDYEFLEKCFVDCASAANDLPLSDLFKEWWWSLRYDSDEVLMVKKPPPMQTSSSHEKPAGSSESSNTRIIAPTNRKFWHYGSKTRGKRHLYNLDVHGLMKITNRVQLHIRSATVLSTDKHHTGIVTSAQSMNAHWPRLLNARYSQKVCEIHYSPADNGHSFANSTANKNQYLMIASNERSHAPIHIFVPEESASADNLNRYFAGNFTYYDSKRCMLFYKNQDNSIDYADLDALTSSKAQELLEQQQIRVEGLRGLVPVFYGVYKQENGDDNHKQVKSSDVQTTNTLSLQPNSNKFHHHTVLSNLWPLNWLLLPAIEEPANDSSDKSLTRTMDMDLSLPFFAHLDDPISRNTITNPPPIQNTSSQKFTLLLNRHYPLISNAKTTDRSARLLKVNSGLIAGNGIDGYLETFYDHWRAYKMRDQYMKAALSKASADEVLADAAFNPPDSQLVSELDDVIDANDRQGGSKLSSWSGLSTSTQRKKPITQRSLHQECSDQYGLSLVQKAARMDVQLRLKSNIMECSMDFSRDSLKQDGRSTGIYQGSKPISLQQAYLGTSRRSLLDMRSELLCRIISCHGCDFGSWKPGFDFSASLFNGISQTRGTMSNGSSRKYNIDGTKEFLSYEKWVDAFLNGSPTLNSGACSDILEFDFCNFLEFEDRFFLLRNRLGHGGLPVNYLMNACDTYINQANSIAIKSATSLGALSTMSNSSKMGRGPGPSSSASSPNGNAESTAADNAKTDSGTFPSVNGGPAGLSVSTPCINLPAETIQVNAANLEPRLIIKNDLKISMLGEFMEDSLIRSKILQQLKQKLSSNDPSLMFEIGDCQLLTTDSIGSKVICYDETFTNTLWTFLKFAVVPLLIQEAQIIVSCREYLMRENLFVLGQPNNQPPIGLDWDDDEEFSRLGIYPSDEKTPVILSTREEMFLDGYYQPLKTVKDSNFYSNISNGDVPAVETPYKSRRDVKLFPVYATMAKLSFDSETRTGIFIENSHADPQSLNLASDYLHAAKKRSKSSVEPKVSNFNLMQKHTTSLSTSQEEILKKIVVRNRVTRADRHRFSTMAEGLMEIDEFRIDAASGMDWLCTNVLAVWLERVCRVGCETKDFDPRFGESSSHSVKYSTPDKSNGNFTPVYFGKDVNDNRPSNNWTPGRLLPPKTQDPVKRMINNRRYKKIFLRAAYLFSTQDDVAECLKYLSANHLIPETPDASVVADLFHILPVEKKKLGIYLSKPKNYEVLKQFMNKFDWKQFSADKRFDMVEKGYSPNHPGIALRIDEALRMVLAKFRLPGESQQIERVVDAFSDGYFNQCLKQDAQNYLEFHEKFKEYRSSNTLPTDEQPHDQSPEKTNHLTDPSNPPPQPPTGFSETHAPPLSPDSVSVLAYAVIMLNTDQHHPQVRRRMTKEDFVKNLRQSNKHGLNFSRANLEEIYDSIKNEEIVMPDELDADSGYDLAIEECFSEKSTDPSVVSCWKANGNEVDLVRLDREIFQEIWKSVASTALYCYDASDSQSMVHITIQIYHQLCALAFYYGFRETLDELLVSMMKSTRLLQTYRLRLSDTLKISESMSSTDVVKFAVYKPEEVALEFIEDEADSDPYLRDKRRGEFLLWFSRHKSYQASLVMAFKNMSEYIAGVCDSWVYAMEILLNLHKYDLMTPVLLEVTDYTAAAPFEVQIPRVPILQPPPEKKKPSKQVPERQQSQSSSIFSAISNFLLSTTSPEEEKSILPDYEMYKPSEKEKDAENKLTEMLLDLRLDRLILGKSKYLSMNGYRSMLNGLSQASIFRKFYKRRPVKNTGRLKSIKMSRSDIDGAIFTLELLVKICCANPTRISQTFSFYEAIFIDMVIKNAQNLNHILVERAITGWFKIGETLFQYRFSSPAAKHDDNMTNDDYFMRYFSSINCISEVLLASSTQDLFDNTTKNNPSTATDHGKVNLLTGLPGHLRLFDMITPATMASLHHFLESVFNTTGSDFMNQTWFLPPLLALLKVGAKHISISPSKDNNQENLGKTSYKLSVQKSGIKFCWNSLALILKQMHIDPEKAEKPEAALLESVRSVPQKIFVEIREICVSLLSTIGKAKLVEKERLVSVGSIISKLASVSSTSKESSETQPKDSVSEDKKSTLKPRDHDVMEADFSFFGKKSLEILYLFYISHLSSDQAGYASESMSENMDFWPQYGLPILLDFAHQCHNSIKEVSQNSFFYLQKSIFYLEDHKILSRNDNTKVILKQLFESVLFPLIDGLVKPPNASIYTDVREGRLNSDSDMDDYIIRSITLLSKTFLHFINKIKDSFSASEFNTLWVDILDKLQSFWVTVNASELRTKDQPSIISKDAEEVDITFNSGSSSEVSSIGNQNSSLMEAIPETVKNMVLVMHTSGIFEGGNDKNDMWSSTWAQIQNWLPNIQSEIFPEDTDLKFSSEKGNEKPKIINER